MSNAKKNVSIKITIKDEQLYDKKTNINLLGMSLELWEEYGIIPPGFQWVQTPCGMMPATNDVICFDGNKSEFYPSKVLSDKQIQKILCEQIGKMKKNG